MAICFECMSKAQSSGEGVELKIKKGMQIVCTKCGLVRKEGTLVKDEKPKIKEHEIAIAEIINEVKELRDLVEGLIEQQQGTDRLLLNHLKVGDTCPHNLK